MKALTEAINRLAQAIENASKLAPSGTNVAPSGEKKGAPKGEPASDEPTGPTLEQLRETAQKLIKLYKAGDLRSILKKFKAESLSKLDPKHYEDVNTKLEEILAAAD